MIIIAANADIFFDETLQRVSGAGLRRPQLQRDRKILALLKWIFNQQSASMSMNVRTDSQGECSSCYDVSMYSIHATSHACVRLEHRSSPTLGADRNTCSGCWWWC